MADVKEKKVEEKKVSTSKETAKKNAEVKEAKATSTKQAKTEKAVKTETKKASTATTAKKAEKAASTTAKKEVAKSEVKATVKEDKKSSEKEEELVATATVKYERISSRKVKIVADLIRGKNVDEAMAILQFTNKAGADVLEKLLKSAIANAENTKQMAHSKLYVAEVYSNQGPTLKRIRAAAKGSAVRIRKRTSHTTIVLKERD